MVNTGEIWKTVLVPTKKYKLEWKIPDFDLISQEPDFSFNCGTFYFAGDGYYLSFYPNGVRSYDSVGYIGVYLIRVQTFLPSTLKITFRIKGLNEETEEHDAEKLFVKTKRVAYGVHRLLDSDELFRRHLELLPSSILTIICTIEVVKSSEDTSEPSTSKALTTNTAEKKLLNNFLELLLKKEDSDVVIKVQGQEFPAHRNILIARSSVFALIFGSDMKETTTGIVDIEDCDPSTFSDFLNYLYCADVANLSKQNVFDLFAIADKYDVQDLRTICLDFVKENLSVGTFCDTVTLAHLYSETELVKLSTEFFVNNACKIIETEEWQSFLVENPTQADELLIQRKS